MNVPGSKRIAVQFGAIAVLLLTPALTACSGSEGQTPSMPTAPKASSPASGTVVARIESRDAGEALQAYLEGWMRDFNHAAVGSDVGTAPLAAASAVPLDQHDTVTLSEFTFAPEGAGSHGKRRYRAAFSFWRGNPLSSSYAAQPLESSSTYEVTWDDSSSSWVITLRSPPPDSDPQPTRPE